MTRTVTNNPQGRLPNTAGEGASTLRARSIELEKRFRRCRRQRWGAAVVEFAIVAPLLFLFVFGLIEYGRMVMVQQVITNASREAARRAVLDGATYAEVNTFVSGYLTSAAIPTAAVKPVTINPSNPAAATYGAPVSVTVSIDFNKVSWLPKPIWLGGKSLQATTTMRRESAS